MTAQRTRPFHRRSRDGLAATRVAVVLLALLITAVVRPTEAPAQPPGDGDAGAQVYRQQCAMCHGDDATGMLGVHPALGGAVDRLGTEGVDVAIRVGRATTPPMPSFEDRLTDEEIADVTAYISSLPDGPRNFGPEMDGMGDMGTRGGRMMDGFPPIAALALVGLLAAGLGYLIGRSRRNA